MAMQKLSAFLAAALVISLLLAAACGAAEERSGPERGFNAAAEREIIGQEFGAAAGAATMPQAAMARDDAGGSDFFDADTATMATPAPMPAAAMVETMAADGGDGGSQGSSRETSQAIDRKIIATATLTVEADSVERATALARGIAENLGGFVAQLSSSGGAQSPRADLTIRVPQPQFFPALERIEALGEVQSRTLGREDVTERYIDLSARLKSAEREEQSLLNLLGRSSSVAEILSVERELARVRAEVERLQGQLNFLERQVDLASIHLTLLPPGSLPTNPPIANFTLGVSNVADRVAQLKTFVAGLEGEIDEVYLSTSERGERAEVNFRVYAQDFDRTTAFVTDQGRLTYRELREAINQSDAPQARRPDARIVVSYVDAAFNFQPWLLAGILAAAAALAGGVALLTRFAYRRGRIRGRFF